MHWYVVESGQPTGPHDRVAIERLVALGRITAGTKVCVVGDTAWTHASQDPVIAALIAQPHPAADPETGLLDMNHPSMKEEALSGLFRDLGATASAEARLGASHPPLATTPIPEEELPAFTYGGSSQLGHKAFKARWSALVLIGLIYLALSYALGVPGMISGMLRAAAEESGTAAPGALALDVFGWFLSILIGGPLLSGFVVAGARAVRGAGQVSDLFLGFQRYGSVVLAYFVSILLIGVAVVAAAIPGLVMLGVAVGFEMSGNFGKIGPLGAVGVLLAALGALAVSIWIMPRLIYMGALAADPSLPKEGLEATLRRSWSLTAGKAPAMFALLFVYGIVLVLSVFLLCVGLPLLGMPLFAAVQGAMYASVFSAGHPRRLGS